MAKRSTQVTKSAKRQAAGSALSQQRKVVRISSGQRKAIVRGTRRAR